MRAVILAALMIPAVARATDPGSTCIWERDLDHTEVVDDSTILFHMHGHKTWKNTLPVRCFGLKHEPDGFTYQPTDPSMQELCSNQVTIRLNSLHSSCQLGNFTQVR